MIPSSWVTAPKWRLSFNYYNVMIFVSCFLVLLFTRNIRIQSSMYKAGHQPMSMKGELQIFSAIRFAYFSLRNKQFLKMYVRHVLAGSIMYRNQLTNLSPVN